jgi:hypothetical protein
MRGRLPARQATEKDHDLNVTLSDGFVSTPNCVMEPGSGCMGTHYLYIPIVQASVSGIGLEPATCCG